MSQDYSNQHGSFDSGFEQITTVVRMKLAVDAAKLTVSMGIVP